MLTTIRQKLESHGRPIVTLPQIAEALNVEYGTLHQRIRKLKPEEHPENHGMFLAGGVRVFVTDSGVRWAERHAAYWKAIRGDKDAI